MSAENTSATGAAVEREEGSSVARPCESQATATALVDALVAGGVRHVVVCPGSRSAPIAYALQAAQEAGLLTVHVRLDERSAGFHALGLAIGSGLEGQVRAAAVLTTSGTAVANLHPAVLEASHARVPLVVLSADRPHEMRGTGANQTTDQVRIFGSAVRLALDVPAGMPRLGPQVTRALAAAHGTRGTTPGPVQLNIALRDPLVPNAPWSFAAAKHADDTAPGRVSEGEDVLRLAPGGRTVVVAGDRAGVAAAEVARAGGWPLLAEPSSGVRHLPQAVPAYRTLLGVAQFGGQVERVIVLGHPTLSRPVSALLARPEVEVIVVDRHQEWTDVAGTARQVVGLVEVAAQDGTDPSGPHTPTDPAQDAWVQAWQQAGSAVAERLLDHQARPAGPTDAPCDPLDLAATVWAGTDADTPLVLGSSSGVRDLDLVAGPGGPRMVVANRGLAGIDGTLATAMGVAQGCGRPVRVFLGDLTYLHDAASLAVGALEQEPNVQVIVADDHGGGIFSTLEYAETAGEEQDTPQAHVFERLFGTPQATDLVALAAAHGARAEHTEPSTLARQLHEPIRGRQVLVVPTDRRVRRARGRAAADAARDLA